MAVRAFFQASQTDHSPEKRPAIATGQAANFFSKVSDHAILTERKKARHFPSLAGLRFFSSCQYLPSFYRTLRLAQSGWRFADHKYSWCGTF